MENSLKVPTVNMLTRKQLIRSNRKCAKLLVYETLQLKLFVRLILRLWLKVEAATKYSVPLQLSIWTSFVDTWQARQVGDRLRLQWTLVRFPHRSALTRYCKFHLNTHKAHKEGMRFSYIRTMITKVWVCKQFFFYQLKRLDLENIINWLWTKLFCRNMFKVDFSSIWS